MEFFRSKNREERVRDCDVNIDPKDANRRKTIRSLAFIFTGIALAVLGLKLESLPRVTLLGQIVIYLGFGAFLIGFVLGLRAEAERDPLAKPESKEPPSIWDSRRPR